MEKKLNKKLWDELIKESNKTQISVADLSIVNNDSLKKLRNELAFTQNKFADILGVSNKTIEKWEQGKNPINGPAQRLIYLIMKDHEIIERIYKVEKVIPSSKDWNKIIKVQMIKIEESITNEEKISFKPFENNTMIKENTKWIKVENNKYQTFYS